MQPEYDDRWNWDPSWGSFPAAERFTEHSCMLAFIRNMTSSTNYIADGGTCIQFPHSHLFQSHMGNKQGAWGHKKAHTATGAAKKAPAKASTSTATKKSTEYKPLTSLKKMTGAPS